ncbi:MAG: S8 family serine peptidase [Nanoarchaeota archaeon]|nr:S8 family serine peptidase [Nanoarchaeota archaeon]
MRKKWWTIVIVLIALVVVVASYNYLTIGVLLAPKLSSGDVDADVLEGVSEEFEESTPSESDLQSKDEEEISVSNKNKDLFLSIEREELQAQKEHPIQENRYILVLSEKGLVNIGFAERFQKSIDFSLHHQQLKEIAGPYFYGSVSNVLNAVFLRDIPPAELSDVMSYAQSIYPDAKLYPDLRTYPTLLDSIPLINADHMWNLGYTGSGIRIAIIDSGVDYTHPDLGSCTMFSSCPRYLDGYDFINEDEDPWDDLGHGTHVTATAAGNGATFKGVAPDADLYIYKIFDSRGGGGYYSRIIAAIDRALDPNNDSNYDDMAHVISMSIGGRGTPEDPLSRAVDNAYVAGSLVVVAAGNFWGGAEYGDFSCPGCATHALAVGATNKQDEIAYFSGRGPVLFGDGDLLVKPEITAPGVDICAADAYPNWPADCFDNEHLKLWGTSMATPHVAGAAALLLQAHPTWTPRQLTSALLQGSKDIGEDIYIQGSGRLDVLASYNQDILVSPNPVSLKVYKVGDTLATFSINVENMGSTQQGIHISKIDIININTRAKTSQTVNI